MTPSDLAAKIAEEVFRTIERENGIVKAEIADGIEKVIAKEMPEFLQHRGKTWGLWSDYGLPSPGTSLYRLAPRVKDASKYNLDDWKTVEVPGPTEA